MIHGLYSHADVRHPQTHQRREKIIKFVTFREGKMLKITKGEPPRPKNSFETKNQPRWEQPASIGKLTSPHRTPHLYIEKKKIVRGMFARCWPRNATKINQKKKKMTNAVATSQ